MGTKSVGRTDSGASGLVSGTPMAKVAWTYSTLGVIELTVGFLEICLQTAGGDTSYREPLCQDCLHRAEGALAVMKS